jgi:hypothetical protein
MEGAAIAPIQEKIPGCLLCLASFVGPEDSRQETSLMNTTPDPEEHVVVHTFSDPNTAEIVANALRDEGIACEIEGEQQAGFTGVGALTVRLLVRAIDRARAEEILDAHKPL